MSRAEENLVGLRDSPGFGGIIKTTSPLILLVALVFSMAPEVGGAPSLVPIVEGVNILTTAMMDDIIIDRTLHYASFYEAPSALATTLITTNGYPAPRWAYRHMLKRPVEEIEGDVYEVAAERVSKNFSFENTIVIARGDLPVDSIAAAAYAKSQNLPVLLTRPEEVPGFVLNTIQRLRPKKIIILGGEVAVSAGVEEDLRGIADAERVWGETRYETAVEIARRAVNLKTIVVTNGENPSMEAVIIGAEYRAPIIYVTPTGIPDSVKEFLTENKLNSEGRPMKIVLVDVNATVGEEIRNLTLTRELGAKLEVMVVNNDNSDLYVDLYIDKYQKIQQVKSGVSLSYGVFKLDVGEHNLRIRWLDPSTDEFYEKEEKVTLSMGEEASRTLYVDLHTFAERK
ncbi:MAG: cell wall-binding repeat-containing protein [Candidatus Hydrothermarchaeaceae archaeon]